MGWVVKELVDVADVRYAVLEALRTEGGSERFVVAYPNEDCLYHVIAAPRIVEFGFSSREAAAGVPIDGGYCACVDLDGGYRQTLHLLQQTVVGALWAATKELKLSISIVLRARMEFFRTSGRLMEARNHLFPSDIEIRAVQPCD
jgi:hypothetical protein